MTNEELKANRIIAEFDGWKNTGQDYFGNESKSPLYEKDGKLLLEKNLVYHSDMNKLFAVCRKWSELEFDGKDQTWEYDFYTGKLQELAGKFEINPLFNQLVKNIEWYNSTKDK